MTARSYKVEVITDNSGKWYGNAMRYPTEEVAKAAALDLYARWTLVRQWRTAESDDAPNADMNGKHIGTSRETT